MLHTILAYKLQEERKAIETQAPIRKSRIQPAGTTVPRGFAEVDKDIPKTRRLNQILRLALLTFIGIFIAGYMCVMLYAEFVFVGY